MLLFFKILFIFTVTVKRTVYLFYIKKLVPNALQGSHGLQGSGVQQRRRTNNSNKSIFVLLARSVLVADATIPISITKRISLEKFIKTPCV